MNEVIRVLLVGGDETMRRGLQQILDRKEEIRVIGEVSSGEEAPAEAGKLLPDVILMLADTGMSDIEVTRAINETPSPGRVVLLTENLGRYLVPAIKAGVAGILPRNISPDELAAAIRRIHRWCRAPSNCGDTPMNPDAASFEIQLGG